MTQPLFEALPEIGEQIDPSRGLLLCLDFDGTLTPLVDRPETVVLAPQVRAALADLAKHDGIVTVIISGRQRSDLQARVGLPGLVYAGNHGLEISGPGLVFVEPTAAGQVEAMKALAADLAGRLEPLAGAFVEEKGLTLSVHYRMVGHSAVEEVRHLVHTILAATDHPFHLTTGDKVFEIRPRVNWNKGTALNWVREQTMGSDALTIYFGDDTTDEDAFSALPDDITVKVGATGESTAKYRVPGPAEVLKFLEWLVLQVNEQPARRF